MPRSSQYDQLTPSGGKPVQDEWAGLPDQGEDWTELPDNTPTPDLNMKVETKEEDILPDAASMVDTVYPETKFNTGETLKNFPSWTFTPGEEAKPSDPEFNLGMLKDQLTWPNAVRFGGSLLGDFAGAALAPVTFGAAYPALSFAGGAGSEGIARWMEGKEFNPYIMGVEGAANLIPGPNIPGAGAGLRGAAKYALKSAESGGIQGMIGATPRKMAEEGIWDKEGNLNYADVNETAAQAGAGALIGGVTGAGLHAGATGYRGYKANQALNDFNGPIPPNAKQAGNSSTLWDNVDFTQPVNEQRLLGAGPERIVTLTSPDIATIQGWRDQGYVMIPRDPVTGHFRMAHESIASQYIPEEPTDQDISLQYNAPDNVVPFPQPTPPPPPDLDTTLDVLGAAGERMPRNYDEQNAWEETPDDAFRGGPVGIVPRDTPSPIDPTSGPIDELRQQNLPLNKRVIERAQRALRPSVPDAPVESFEGLPPHLTSDYQQTLPMYPTNPEEGGTGSAAHNPIVEELRQLYGREPTNEEIQLAMWGTPADVDYNTQVISNRGLTDPHNTISTSGPGEGIGPTSELSPPDLTTRAGIDAAYSNYQIDHQQWVRAAEALERQNQPASNAFRPRISPYAEPPYDPHNVLPGHTSEIDGINSEARALEHEHYWNTEAANSEGDERVIANYIADYAHDRAMELRQNPDSVRQVPYVQDNSSVEAIERENLLRDSSEEINATVDVEDALGLMRYWREEAAHATNPQDRTVYQRLADLAARRVEEHEAGGFGTRASEVDGGFQPDTTSSIYNQTDIDRLMQTERRNIRNARDEYDARALVNFYERSALSLGGQDPIRGRAFSDLLREARARLNEISNLNSYRRPVQLAEAANPNDALPTRIQHKARVAAERARKNAEEAAIAGMSSPLPVYRGPSGEPSLPGIEPSALGTKIMEGGEKLPPAPDITNQRGEKLFTPKLPFKNKEVSRRMEIRVSQELMDTINKTISEIDPDQLLSALSHHYAESTLASAKKGPPGITVEKNRYSADIYYRNANGQTIAKATVNLPWNDPSGQAQIASFVSDKSSGAEFGRGAFAIAKEFLKLGAFSPSGGYSPHTRNFIQQVQKFLAVDRTLGKGGPESHYDFEGKAKEGELLPPEDFTGLPDNSPRGIPSDSNGEVDITPLLDETGQISENTIDDAIAAESVRREPLVAIGDAFDQVTAAVMDAHAASQLVDSPVTVREIADRVMSEVDRRVNEAAEKARAAGIERGEILGGPPDDNGPGTTVGMGFGGMGEGFKKVKENAGWGQGNRERAPSRPESETQASEDYNWMHEALTLPRNAITTLDISYAGRQGLGAITRPEFWHAFRKQFGAATQRGFDALDAVNRASPVWQRPLGAPTRAHPNGAPQPSIGEVMGLTLYEPASSTRPGARNQQVASKWLEMGIGEGKLSDWYRRTYGRGVRASNRMYIAMANTLTTKMAENMVRNSEDMANETAMAAGPTGTASMRPGLLKGQYTAAQAMEYNPYYNQAYARELGDYIRTALGQAPLRAHFLPHQSLEVNAERMAGFLNKTLLSSGLFASRVRLTSPMQYVMASPKIRKEMMRSMLGVQAFWWGGAYSLKMLLDATGISDSSINLDWTSADFGKLRIGNMRFDLAGGFQQFLVQYGRMWAGGKTSSASTSPTGGNFQKFGQGYMGESWGESTQRFLSNKLEPITKFAYDFAYATENKPFHVGDRTLQLAFSLYHQDLLEIAKERPYMLPLASPLTLFGAGTQIYDRNESVGRILPPEYDLIYKGKGGLRAIMPWNWDETEGEYQGPGR